MLLGYSISSLARPFIALTGTWMQVFAVRVLDRVGKGVRSAPRDAMLASWATPSDAWQGIRLSLGEWITQAPSLARHSRPSFCSSIRITTAFYLA